MSDLKRYIAVGDGIVRTDNEGPLVMHSDYAKLKAEVDALRNAGDELAENLKVQTWPWNSRFKGLAMWIAAREGNPTK